MRSPFTRIDHVQLAMPPGEEAQARAFYGGVLGMHELAKPPELAVRGGVWFASGEVQIHLGVEADFRPARKAHPALRCPDYAALLMRLREALVHVRDDGAMHDGALHAYIDDPFGNRLEVIEIVIPSE